MSRTVFRIGVLASWVMLMALSLAGDGVVLGQPRPGGAAPAAGGALAAMKVTETRYYSIRSDLPADDVREAGLRMTRIAEEYYARTQGMGGGVIRERLPFYLFTKAEDYYAAGGPKGSQGVYIPFAAGNRLMAWVPAENPDKDLWNVVQHEGFHQFAHHVLGGQLAMPNALDEGMAEYFAEASFTGDGLVTGGIPPARLKRVQERIRTSTWGGTLKQLLNMPASGWKTHVSYYDHSWSLVHFLVHGENGKYLPGFNAFVADLVKKQPWEQAWQARLGPIETVEKQYKEWWLKQTEDPAADVYAKATVATLSSYLGRAAAQKQTFTDFAEFSTAARAAKLKSAPEDWLPPKLLEKAIETAERDGGRWTLRVDAAKAVHVATTTQAGARLVGNARLNPGHIWQTWVDVYPPAGVAKLPTPVKVSAFKLDKSPVIGRIASYNLTGFSVLDDRNASREVKWTELSAPMALNVYESLLSKTSGEDWLAAGKVLSGLPDGKTSADWALSQAVRADPKLQAAADAIKDPTAVAAAPPAVAVGPTPPAVGRPDDKTPGGGRPDEKSSSDIDYDTARPGAGPGKSPVAGRPVPPSVGETGPSPTRPPAVARAVRSWPEQSPEDRADVIKSERAVVESSRSGRGLTLTETRFFLVYSDLPAKDAKESVDTLEKIYDRLSKLFGLAAGENIFKGKMVAAVFAGQDEYLAFEREVHDADSRGMYGGSTCFADGRTRLVFLGKPSETKIAHSMASQMVHCFMHRYRSAERMPSWFETGLGDMMSFDLVAQPNRAQDRADDVKQAISQGVLNGDFFTTNRGLVNWQNALAESLCRYMFRTNPKGMVAFVAGVKDGQTPDESIDKNYGASRDRLVAAYLESMGMRKTGR